MSTLLFASGVLFLLVGFYVSPSIVSGLIGILVVFVIVFALKYLVFYIKESILEDQKPPIAGPILNYLVHFNRLFDYQTSIAKKHSTFRLITPSHSEIYTVDPLNGEYILKTKFSNYKKGAYNYGIMRDLFDDGIFAVDGHKWRHQRKLVSYEFSTRVLRDFSSAVFRSCCKISFKDYCCSNSFEEHRFASICPATSGKFPILLWLVIVK